MSKKNPLSEEERRLNDLAKEYERALHNHTHAYLDVDDLVDLSDWYAQNGQMDEAYEVVEYGLRLYPGDVTLLLVKVDLLIDDQLLEEAQATARLIPDSEPEARMAKARLALERNDYPGACQWLDAPELDTLSDHINIANLFLLYGYYDDALAHIQKALKEDPNDEMAQSIYADTLRGLGEFEMAEDVYNIMLDKDPYSAPNWFGLAQCYFSRFEYEKVFDAVNYAIISDDDFGMAYLLRGHLFLVQGNTEKAEEDFQRAAERGIGIDKINNEGLIHFMFDNERNEEASRLISYKLEHDPLLTDDQRYGLYIEWGICLANLNRMEEAHTHFKEAIKINPSAAAALVQDGRVYLTEGDRDNALACWEKAVEKEPTAETWHHIGTAALHNGYVEMANYAYLQADGLGQDQDALQTPAFIAATYLILGKKKEFEKYNRRCAFPLTEDQYRQFAEKADTTHPLDLTFDMVKTLTGKPLLNDEP